MWFVTVASQVVAGVRRAAAAGLLLAALSSAAHAGPSAVCMAATHDFGTQTDDGVVKHVFRVENRGDAPLTLRVGRACCGAQLFLPKQPVAPGGGVDVRVELTLRGRGGQVAKAIYVLTNDPACPALRLELTGRVIALPGPPPS